MAAVKLSTSSTGTHCRISLNNGATRCDCPVFLQAEMAAVKLRSQARSSNCRNIWPLRAAKCN
eukprot:12421296-Karenia_brevis.AAC.1